MVFQRVFGNENGAVLVTGLMFLALLTILGSSAYFISITEVRISANYKYSEEAFNQAEAGVQYGIGIIQKGLEADSFSLPTSMGSAGTVALPSSSHADFSFLLSSLEKTGNNAYRFTSTGNGPQGATAEIVVTFKMGPAISLGAFGDELVDSKSFAQYYSYDSSTLSNPTPGDSTGQADVGSNGDISLYNHTIVDGDVVCRPGHYTEHGSPGPVITGETELWDGPVDPDPLGVTDPSYKAEFDFYREIVNTKDENNGGLGNTTDKLVVAGTTVTIEAGTYFFTGVEIKKQSGNDGILNIDASSGPVVIYIEGSLVQGSSCELNILNTSLTNDVTIKLTEDPANPLSSADKIIDLRNGAGLNENGPPTGFSIMTDSDAKTEFHSKSDINGLVYVPNSAIIMHNTNTVHGAIWGNEIYGKNDSILYYDTDLRNKYLSNDVKMTSWQQVLK